MIAVSAGLVGWAPLADSDPVPGDPEAIRALAQDHAAQSDTVADQLAALRRIATGDGWCGPAADAYMADVGALPADLSALAERLQRMARALIDYAAELESAQRQARAALAVARAAAPRWGGPMAHELDPEVRRADRMLAAARAERDRAAARCARALSAAGHDRLRDPSRWRRMLDAASDWAAEVTKAVGMAALFFSLVPGLGEILGVAAVVAGSVALLTDVLRRVTGEEISATQLAFDLAGVVPLGRAARLGAVLSRGEAMSRAATALRASSRTGRPLRLTYWRAAPGLIRTRVAFAATRGVHGLAGAAPRVSQLRSGSRDLATAVRRGVAARHPSPFFASPGGVLHELAGAREEGHSGVTWLTGGYAVDVAVAVGPPDRGWTPARCDMDAPVPYSRRSAR